MSDLSLNEALSEKLTLEEWLKKTNELGYFITKPRVVYEDRGWKGVITFASVLMMLGLLMGGMLGGGIIGAKYYECGGHHDK